MWVGRTLINLSGYAKTEKGNIFVDYKPYLGPDWKPKYEGAPTMISNHRSFLDICIGVGHFCGSFVGASMIKNMPGVGTVTECLQCIYVDRVGKDAAASRAKAFEAI
jgi:1-acyl-sn-glycerol-3-phosphate acyltransferase